MDAAQMQMLWDHMQIEKVLAVYCRAIDRCDHALLQSVYWQDAVEEHGLFNGKAWDFADFIIPLLKGMKVTMHQISNVLIRLDDNRAFVETYVVAYHLLDAADGGQSDMVVGGRYVDRLEKRDGEWRIAKRTFVHDWNQNRPATCIWDSGMYAQLNVRGRNDRSDPSYAQ